MWPVAGLFTRTSHSGHAPPVSLPPPLALGSWCRHVARPRITRSLPSPSLPLGEASHDPWSLSGWSLMVTGPRVSCVSRDQVSRHCCPSAPLSQPEPEAGWQRARQQRPVTSCRSERGSQQPSLRSPEPEPHSDPDLTQAHSLSLSQFVSAQLTSHLTPPPHSLI